MAQSTHCESCAFPMNWGSSLYCSNNFPAKVRNIYDSSSKSKSKTINSCLLVLNFSRPQIWGRRVHSCSSTWFLNFQPWKASKSKLEIVVRKKQKDSSDTSRNLSPVSVFQIRRYSRPAGRMRPTGWGNAVTYAEKCVKIRCWVSRTWTSLENPFCRGKGRAAAGGPDYV